MADKSFAKYSLSGYYLLQGTKGSQTGEVNYYPDGRVMGTIGDCNQSGAGCPTPKFLIGLHDSNTDRLNFLKVANVNRELYPVVWTMDGDKSSRGDGLSNVYDGQYGFIGGLTGILLDLLVSRKNLTPEKIAEELSANDLTQLFEDMNIPYNQPLAKKLDRVGRIEFSLKK